MKKKLEAELISIAHRILKLKNKSNIVALHQETQRLYEKLSVLRFVEESFGDAKPTIGSGEIEEKLDSFFDKEEVAPIQDADAPKSDDANNAPEEKPEVQEVPDKPEMPAVNPDEKHEDEVPDQEKEDDDSAGEEEGAVSEIEAQETAESESDESDGDAIEKSANTKEQDEEKTITAESQKNSAEEIKTDEESGEVEVEKKAAAVEQSNMPNDVPPTVMPPDVAPELEVAKASAEDHDSRKADFLDKDKDPHTKKEDLFIPSFELAFDPKADDAETAASPQFSFDDLLGKDYADPVFVKPGEEKSEKKFSDYTYKDAETIKSESKSVSLNDRLSKGITIGLNDRIAFIKHLFANSSEDYNRVLSQLMTFGTYDEARNFIDDMVKPDYNDWAGKEEYANKFMDIIEKRFS